MRCWPFFFGPIVPGALAPVIAPKEWTQEVGVRDCRLYTAPTGGGEEPVTGTGTLYDEYASAEFGTYDYVVQGKLLTVTLHIPTMPQSVGVALTLRDLPDVEFDNQNFSVVYNEYNVSTVTAMKVQFYQSSGKTYVAAFNAGNIYVSNLVNANNYTFTIRIK